MAPEQNKDSLHTSVSGGFNQHTPAYWRLMIPALMARYIPRWGKSLHTEGYGNRNKFYDIAAGTWAMAVTTFFAIRTGQDIRNVFTEAVGYEVDKAPSQVTMTDLRSSDNKALIKARKNFVFYNSLRAIVNATFFASFMKGGPWYGKDSVDLGVGANAVYLMTEVMMRKNTFFEELQNFIDHKINQRNALGEDIKPIELIRLYERNALDNDPDNAFQGNVTSHMWKQSQVIFQHMADMMNHTYQPTASRQDNFKVPKFLYMLGHGLIQPKKVEQTLAYLEVANRYGMDALKQVVKDVKDGTSLHNALQAYPVTLPEIMQIPPEQVEALQDKRQNTLFTQTIESRRANGIADKSTPAAAYTDKLKAEVPSVGPLSV